MPSGARKKESQRAPQKIKRTKKEKDKSLIKQTGKDL